MDQLNDEQLNMRIESFIARKHQQYPELALRGDKMRIKSTADFISDKLSGFAASIKLAKLAH